MKAQLIYYVEVFFLLLCSLGEEVLALLVRQENAVSRRGFFQIIEFVNIHMLVF